jgi:ribosomal protein S18|tara:strand:- start:1775 stop:2371 length:597 start_codon:yes stop_codon:yes gene_type:complete
MSKKKRKKIKKKSTTYPTPRKKFYKLNSKLISSTHYWPVVRDVFRQFGYHLPRGDKHIEASLEKRKWLSVALAYELAGYNHKHAFKALTAAGKDAVESRLQPARGIHPALVMRLINFNKKLGGAANLFHHSYLQRFYKVTKIPKFKSVVTLQRFITRWRRILKLPVRTHYEFDGSVKQQRYIANAIKKQEAKGFKGKR